MPKLNIEIDDEVIRQIIMDIDEPGVRQIKKIIADISDKYKFVLYFFSTKTKIEFDQKLQKIYNIMEKLPTPKITIDMYTILKPELSENTKLSKEIQQRMYI